MEFACKLFVFLCIIFSPQQYGQNYHFDEMFYYQITIENGDNKRNLDFVIYKKSHSTDYYLIQNLNQDKTYIYDFPNKLQHELNTELIDNKQEINNNFIFIATKKININSFFQWKYYKNLYCEWIKNNDSIENKFTNYTLKIYKNKKKKRPIMTVDLKAEYTSTDYFDVFLTKNLHGFEFNPLIFSDKPLKIHEAKWKSISGIYLNHSKLIESKETDFQIIIP